MSEKHRLWDKEFSITLTLSEWKAVVDALEEDDLADLIIKKIPRRLRNQIIEELKGSKA